MSQLQDNLNAILTQKNQLLIPTNIKNGVEILGVVGSLEPTVLDMTDTIVEVDGTTLVFGENNNGGEE